MKKDKKSLKIEIRCTEWQFNRIQGLADMYADGNKSRWALHHAINGERRRLKKQDQGKKR